MVVCEHRISLRALRNRGRKFLSSASLRSLKLDRETEALLHWVSSTTATPLWRLAPDAARDEYRRWLAKTEIAPPEIGQASDLAVPGHAAPMQVRKYVPADAIRLCSHCSMRCSPKAAFDARLPGVLATVVIEELARMSWP